MTLLALLVPLLVPVLGACKGTVWDPSGSPDGTPDGMDRVEAPPAVGDEFRCDDPRAGGPAPLRRLTIPEYIATLEASLGVDVTAEAESAIPGDVRADGFSNTASGLVVDVAHVEAFASVGQTAVDRVSDFAPLLADAGVSCGELTAECEAAAIEALAILLYRGPATNEEVASLSSIYDAVEGEGGDFAEGTRYVALAMLQSPRFLYKIEHQTGAEGLRTLSGWEMASRLSYLLWNAPPDEMLRTAAAADALGTDAQLSAHVERMLESPRARETSLRYLEDWLHLGRLDNVVREADAFPGFDERIARDMKAETRAFFERLVWEERRPLGDLWNAQVTFLSGRLAAYYGLEATSDDLSAVSEYDVSDIPERGGFLTQGSLLTIGGPSASMVARGKFFLENVLCGLVNDPPPGIDTTPPEAMPGYSQRDQSEERRENPTCGGCHGQMDPLAYGLERFDGAGAFRLVDEFDNELREDGEVLFPGTSDPVPFDTVGELMDVLAGSDRVRDCTSLKATQFALGRGLADSDGCTLVDIRDRFAASSGTYQDLMTAIALSPGFRTIRVD